MICPFSKQECTDRACGQYCGMQGSAKCRLCGEYLNYVSRVAQPKLCMACWREVTRLFDKYGRAPEADA